MEDRDVQRPDRSAGGSPARTSWRPATPGEDAAHIHRPASSTTSYRRIPMDRTGARAARPHAPHGSQQRRGKMLPYPSTCIVDDEPPTAPHGSDRSAGGSPASTSWQPATPGEDAAHIHRPASSTTSHRRLPMDRTGARAARPRAPHGSQQSRGKMLPISIDLHRRRRATDGSPWTGQERGRLARTHLMAASNACPARVDRRGSESWRLIDALSKAPCWRALFPLRPFPSGTPQR